MFFVALTPLLPDYADQYDLSKAGVGVLAAAYPIGALAGGIPGGLATARFGARPTTIVGVLVIAVTTMVFATGDSIVVLDTARFVQGFGSAFAWTGGAHVACRSDAGRAPRPDDRSRDVAAIVGALFGPVLGGVASVVGQPPAFGTAGLIAVALAVWAFFTSAPPPTRPQPLQLFVRALRNRRIVLSVWFVVLPALLFGTLERAGAAAARGARLQRRGDRRSLALHCGPRGDRERARRDARRLGSVVRPLLASRSVVVAARLPWPNRALVLALLVVAAGSRSALLHAGHDAALGRGRGSRADYGTPSR